MAEEAGDKTEPATPKRRQQAMDQGQAPRSQDLNAAILLLAGVLVIQYTGGSLVNHMAAMMTALLGGEYTASGRDMFDNSLRIAGPHVVRALLPVMLLMAAVAFVLTFMQNGWRIPFKPLMPNFARLNPLQGLGTLFKGPNFVQSAMNLVKLGILAVVLWIRVQQQSMLIITLSAYSFPENIIMGMNVIFDLGVRLAVALVILALLDWMYHKWKFEKDIRMTKQEIKDEARSSEGDVETKMRRRSLARKMMLQRINTDVPRADVVVTNPTELAIALKYDADKMGAPRVLAKGGDYLAMRIRQVAVQHGVPIVERKPLAQALYKSVEVGQEVPPQFYKAIAEILAYVFELSGKGSRIKSQQGTERKAERQKELV